LPSRNTRQIRSASSSAIWGSSDAAAVTSASFPVLRARRNRSRGCRHSSSNICSTACQVLPSAMAHEESTRATASKASRPTERHTTRKRVEEHDSEAVGAGVKARGEARGAAGSVRNQCRIARLLTTSRSLKTP
jgi:hypothetical protein